VSGGQAHETTAFTDLLENASIPDDEGDLDIYPAHLAGDKGYDAQWIRDWLEAEGIEPVIPHRGTETTTPDADFDRQLYRHRNVIERLVGRLKECRRIFSRYEKTATNYLGMIKMSFIRYYLNLFCPTGFSNKA
jgi:transposase